MTSSVQTCPYSWCSNEKSIPCSIGGATITHYSPASTVEAGDDRVTVQVIGVPGHDADDVYVEVTGVERVPGGHRTSCMFLTVADTDELIAALGSARAMVAGQG